MLVYTGIMFKDISPFWQCLRRNLIHVGSKHIVRRYFEISAYLVLILFRYKCSYHHCSMYAAYFVLSFCKNICQSDQHNSSCCIGNILLQQVLI